MKKRISKVIFGAAFVLFLGTVSCHTPQLLSMDTVQNTAIIFPQTDLLTPPCITPFDLIMPQPTWEEIKYPYKNVTLDFTARDKNHVRTQDAMLFSDNNTEIIDLAYLKEKDYAFPLCGAKVISPYAGRRVNHSGIDLKTRANDTIVVAFDGVVRMSQVYAAYGNVVVVRHYNGLETVYSHNSKNLVKPGDLVQAGTPIALTGRTGRATTEHLHFETRINGQHFNPELVFDFQTQHLQQKSLLCTKKGNSINVRTVDPLPNQLVAR